MTPLLPKLDKLLGQSFPPEASTLALQLSNNDLSAAVAIMEETQLQDLMTYRLTLSPRSSEGFSPNRGLRSKSISVVSPGSMLESDQVRRVCWCWLLVSLLLCLLFGCRGCRGCFALIVRTRRKQKKVGEFVGGGWMVCFGVCEFG